MGSELDVFESRHGRTLDKMSETRDPTAATQQLNYVPGGNAMVPEWNADEAIRFGYLANVIAFRCVQIRANTIASLSFRAGADPAKPIDWNPNAPLARLLGPAPHGPAPKLSARKLWAWSVAQRIVTGRWAWELELEQGGDGIVNIWPLVAANLKAIPTEQGVDWFRAFTYGRNDNPKRLSKEQVFYCWDPSPTDFRQPLSALQSARYDLSIAVMGDRYSYSFLKNGAVPAAVVVTTDFPDKASRHRFRNQWRAQYQGPDNAGKVAFHEVSQQSGGDGEVGKAIDVKVLGLSQKDAKFIEQHKASLEMVAISLGVPWSKLDASGRTFDNATQEDASFWESTILPDLRTYEDEINMELAPRVGTDTGWFDLSSVKALKVKPEPTTAKVGAPALVQAQIMTVNEARAEYGLPPVPDGDRMMTAEEIALLRGGPGPSDVGAPVRSIEAPPEPKIPARPAPTRTAPVEVVETRMTAAELEQRRARIWRRTDATAKMLESRWQRAFTKLFERQGDATLSRLTGKRGRQLERRDSVDPASIFDANFWKKETEGVADDLYEAVTTASGSRLTDTLGIDFDLADPRVRDFIKARANQLAGQVTDTTYGAITDVLAEGAAAGEGIPELAARVRHVFDVASESRSVTIARTEVISAYNGSTAEFAVIAGPDVVAGQEWIATRDSRTRSTHSSVDGDIAMVGETFSVGGSTMLYPGDPNGAAKETVNCRCTVALLTPEDLAEVQSADTGRSVSVGMARAVITLAGAGQFDERRTRQALQEAVA